MGVTGLWRLIDASGKPVPLETLEGKVLAIDISIWIHQVLQGYQDKRGNAVPNAHLLGLFHRICKVLFFKIKPVFVFDGGVPLLKKNTIATRKKHKAVAAGKAEKMKNDLLANLMKHSLVKGVLLKKTPEDAPNPSTSSKSEKAINDMFKLPDPLEPVESSSDSDSESFDLSPRKQAKWKGNIHTVDVTSADFKSLPADVRYDILTDLKETRKQNSWGRLHEIPEESNQFSSYQMKRLLKRRKVQESLEAAEQEMGGKNLTLEELEKLMTEQGVDTKSRDNAYRIASDNTTRMIYIKDLKSANKKDASLPGCSKDVDEELTVIPEESVVDDINEYDLDNDWDSDIELLEEMINSPKTKKYFGKVQKNPALSYMLENTELSQDQILALIEQSKVNLKNAKIEEKAKRKRGNAAEFFKKKRKVERNLFNGEDSVVIKEEVMTPDEFSDEDFDGEVKENATFEGNSGELSEDSDSDDFVEVEDKIPVKLGKKMEIVIKADDKLEDDMFADVFEDKEGIGDVSSDLSRQESLNYSKNDEKSEQDEDSLQEFGEESEKVSEIELALKRIGETLDKSLGYLKKINNSEEIERNSSKKSADVPEESKEAPVPEEPSNSSNSSKNPEKLEQDEDSPQELVEASKEPSKIDLKPPEKAANSPKKSADVPEDPKQPSVPEEPPDSLNSPQNPQKLAQNDDFLQQLLEESEKTSQIDSETPEKEAASSKKDADIPEESAQPAVPERSSARVESIISRLESSKPELLSKIKNAEDLKNMESQLETENKELKEGIGKLERQSTEVTEQMRLDAQDLLKLFGIPYVVAPQEAEAQCAYLELINLTDGTITDDSDIWLFGGRCVYKNFFNNSKRVMQYLSKDIEHHFKLTRQQMIQLALLVGSDYTVGVQGIGPVTALEILAGFPNDGDDLLRGLSSFSSWLKTGRVAGPGKAALRNKLKNVAVDSGFPSQAVVQAYLFPTVDESKESFTWGKPNLVLLADYTREKFGWTRAKFEEIMGPVVKRLEAKSQKNIMSYFKTKTVPKSIGEGMSKRVQKAVERMGRNPEEFTDEEGEGEGVEKKGKKKGKVQELEGEPVEKVGGVEEVKKKKKEVIPQRERDRQNSLKKKLKAIEVFRKSNKGPGKSRKKATRPKPNAVQKEAQLSESSSDSN